MTELAHVGVKGMKWGVRKARPTDSRSLGRRALGVGKTFVRRTIMTTGTITLTAIAAEWAVYGAKIAADMMNDDIIDVNFKELAQTQTPRAPGEGNFNDDVKLDTSQVESGR